MSVRKTILRELDRARRAHSPSRFLRPSTLRGYADRPDRYQNAVNELLRARLVEGVTDEEGRIAIGLNDHHLADVQRELRPLWARPLLWALIAIVLAVGVSLTV